MNSGLARYYFGFDFLCSVIGLKIVFDLGTQPITCKKQTIWLVTWTLVLSDAWSRLHVFGMLHLCSSGGNLGGRLQGVHPPPPTTFLLHHSSVVHPSFQRTAPPAFGYLCFLCVPIVTALGLVLPQMKILWKGFASSVPSERAHCKHQFASKSDLHLTSYNCLKSITPITTEYISDTYQDLFWNRGKR